MKILKIAAMSLVMATPLAAQDNTAQEEGQDDMPATTMPAVTTTAAPAATTEVEPYVNLFSDEGITARLTESGYTDVVVARDGTKLMITANRDGAEHEMVYDMTTGSLIEVDGAGYSMGTPPAISGSAASEGTSAQESDN